MGYPAEFERTLWLIYAIRGGSRIITMKYIILNNWCVCRIRWGLGFTFCVCFTLFDTQIQRFYGHLDTHAEIGDPNRLYSNLSDFHQLKSEILL